MRKYISDTITKEEVNKWKQGDIITIEAGTGEGKSHFCKTILYEESKESNKKILFLVHRNTCYDQFKSEITRDNKTDIIDIYTYQSLESNYKNFNFNNYKYIICDEFHYFVSDAVFNENTHLSYDILLQQNKCIRIYMSATSNLMKNILKDDVDITKEYKFKRNWSFIKGNITFFNKDSTYELFANECIERDEKAIFFLKSAELANKLYQKYKDYSMLCVSKSNKLYENVNEISIKKMLENEKFDCNILFTTTCIDAGVNIKDRELKHIICDITDIDTMIQCIGRKRILDTDDKVRLYIKRHTNREINCWINSTKSLLELPYYYMDNNYNIDILKQKYSNNEIRHNDMLYYDSINCETDEKGVGVLKVNNIRYNKQLDNIFIWEEMLKSEYGYCDYIRKKLGGKYFMNIEETIKKSDNREYLEKLIGKKLDKEMQKELVEYLNIRDNRNRMQKSLTIINAYLIDNFNLNVISKQMRENGKLARYWYVQEIEDAKPIKKERKSGYLWETSYK